METKLKAIVRIGWIICFGLNAAPSNILAAPPVPGRLELSVDKQEYLLGEPFVGHAKLVIRDEKPFPLEDSFSFEGKLRLYFGYDGGNNMREWNNRGMIGDILKYAEIYVGIDKVEAERMFAGGPFESSGRVYLQARYRVNSDFFWESNIVPVSVIPPLPAEAEAAKLWLNPNVMVIVENPYAFSEKSEGGRLIADLISKFGDTRYGEFARSAKERAVNLQTLVRNDYEKVLNNAKKSATTEKTRELPMPSVLQESTVQSPSSISTAVSTPVIQPPVAKNTIALTSVNEPSRLPWYLGVGILLIALIASLIARSRRR